MPSLQKQMSTPGLYTANFVASCALLRPGRDYEESLRLFAPYREVREPNAEVRNALRDLLIRGKTGQSRSWCSSTTRYQQDSEWKEKTQWHDCGVYGGFSPGFLEQSCLDTTSSPSQGSRLPTESRLHLPIHSGVRSDRERTLTNGVAGHLLR